MEGVGGTIVKSFFVSVYCNHFQLVFVQFLQDRVKFKRNVWEKKLTSDQLNTFTFNENLSIFTRTNRKLADLNIFQRCFTKVQPTPITQQL